MPINTPYAFTLDIIKPTKIPIMEFYQTDVNTSQMDISITNNDEVVDLTGHTLILNIKKSDGTEIQNLATISDATLGLVNVILTTQSLTAIGECRVQLTVFEGTNRKSTHEFKYYVKASLLNAEVPLSSNEYGLLLQLIDDVQEVENILNTSEAERVQAENNRVILYGQLNTLKTELETLQGQLNSLESDVEISEFAREYNEQQRQILKGQLDTLQAELETLQTELNDLNSTVNSNEETRQTNEIQREANEVDRVELKGQLDSLKGSLESLENTLNANDSTRTNTVNNKMYEVDNKVVNYEAIITDIQNRFALLSTSVQQASEVINARTSTIRNRTFADLNSRIAEAEKDILTQQNTQVTDNISYMNVLANSLDGATDVSIKGNTLVNLYPDNIEKVLPIPLSLVDRVDSVFHLANTLEGNSEFNLKGQSLVQLIKNGNFVNTNGWYSVGANNTVLSNTLTNTGTGTVTTPTMWQNTLARPLNQKYFIKGRARVTNANTISLSLSVSNFTTNGGLYVINNPIQNQWYNFYIIATVNSVNPSTFGFYHQYVDTTTANGKVMEVQEVMALDLTSLGLDTLTADQVNAMLPTYFEGISQYEGATYKSIGENLFDGNVYGSVVNSENVDGKSVFKSTGATSQWYTFKGKPNTQYSLKFEYKKDATSIGNPIYRWLYSDGTFSNISNGLTSTEWVEITPTPSVVGKTVIGLGQTYTNTHTTYINKNSIMLNEGSTPKTYSAYRSSQATITDTLRSVGTVADEYIGNKKISRVGRVVLNGSESWADRMVGVTDDGVNRVYSITGLFTYKKPSAMISNMKISSCVGLVDAYSKGEGLYYYNVVDTTYVIYSVLSKTKATDLATFKTWLSTNITEVLYELNTPTESTITPLILPIYTNGTLIVEPTKLFPKLSSQDTYDKTINLKPSTLYSIFVNAKTVGTLEVDCGGNKANITPIATYTNNKVTITTPTTLTHSMLKLKGGNISVKDYMVIEGDVVEPKYFSGISSVESDVVVKSIGENLFDVLNAIYTGGYYSADGSIYVDTANTRINNYIRIKPSTTYVITKYQPVTATVRRIQFYDINKNWISSIELPTTFTTPSNAHFIRWHWNTVIDSTNQTILNLGTTAKPYTPYKEDKLTLSEYLLPEHFPLRSVGGVSDEYLGKKLYKRVKEYTIQASDVYLMYTSHINIDWARIPKKIDSKDYNTGTVVSSTIIENYAEYTLYDMDNVNNIGKFSLRANTLDVFVGFPKGTTLAQAQTQLVGKKLIYQLATPTEINLDRPLNIQIYKNGSIVTEPTKLLPRLTYNFPTNINSGLVGIQKSLQNIKDNQNFIMAYMLDLETRLSLIEGGL